jgi:hypothetical protein
MADWPGNPVASMYVPNYAPQEGGDPAEVRWQQGLANSQTVTEPQLSWSIDCEYYDGAWIDHGQGFFSAILMRLRDDGTWQKVDQSEITLGNDRDNLTWGGTLTVSATMVNETEAFLLTLSCESRNTWPASQAESSFTFTAFQGSTFMGNFTLDFVPISIIYCPPNQDMSASLNQSRDYGTRMTIGQSQGFQSSTSSSVDVDVLGIKMSGTPNSDSQSGNNLAQSGIEISYFRDTILTADNQRAIGRAYWGPLGDIFVVAVNPRFSVNKRADQTLLYSSIGIDQLIVAPAYKLLRPFDDPIISSIPSEVRRRLLELDPFIHNLDQFFPDTGAPLSDAANPYADPARGNRAECLGRWWLNNATELNYSVGEARILKSGEASEVQFQSTATVDESAQVNILQQLGIGARAGSSDGTILGLQSSKETVAKTSSTAACYLIRNQNEKDLDAIEVYYDKVFSTLMFRKIPTDMHRLQGTISGLSGARMGKLSVALTKKDGIRHETLTGADGTFAIPGLSPGVYELEAGDTKKSVNIPGSRSEQPPAPNNEPGGLAPDAEPRSSHPTGPAWTEVQLEGVRRIVRLDRSPLWEVRAAFGARSDQIRSLWMHSSKIMDMDDVASILGMSAQALHSHSSNAVIELPATPLDSAAALPVEYIPILERHGIDSAQKLWQATRSTADLESLAESTGIPANELRAAQDTLNLRRASVSKIGAPHREPQGCLTLIGNWLPWLKRILSRNDYRPPRK